MEESIQENIPQCTLCKTPIQLESIYCANCGFPENGTEKDVAVFHAKSAMKKNENMDADKKINSARNTLYVMAGLNFVFGMVFFIKDQDIALLITYVILSVMYLILAFWSSKKPLMALLLGLLLYITMVIISAIFEPTTIFKGILWKIIIIGYLGKGIYSASAINKN